MFYAMGFPIRVIQSGWILKNKLFKLYYIHDNKEGFIIRSGDTYWVDDVSEALSTMEYPIYQKLYFHFYHTYNQYHYILYLLLLHQNERQK